MARICSFTAVLAVFAHAATQRINEGATKPHILFSLIDDWGWGNFGVHRKDWPTNEVVTPNLDALVADGVLLDRHYVFKYCSPSRCALQSGRNPIHVNVLNSIIQQHNPADPVGGQQGMPVNMTGVAEKLTSGGYITHQVGKWNAGMAHPRQTPSGRGYKTGLNYFDYDTWFWNGTTTRQCNISGAAEKNGEVGVTDLWDTGAPAKGENNSWACSQSNQAPGCIYQDDAFVTRVLDIIEGHDPSTPLFLFWAPHAPHDPYEVQDAYWNKFSSINETYRRYYSAMVNMLDDHVGNVTAALKRRGLWDNLLWIASSDNGGPTSATYGASNWPLRGGKTTIWEGGTRVNAFAAGGFLPMSVRGTVNEGLIGIEDWYTTFCGLAGVDATDAAAAEAGLPAVDGLDMWPMLSGANTTSPRQEVVMGSSDTSMSVGNTTVQGLLRADGWKLLIGQPGEGCWQGPVYPNSSSTFPGCPVYCGDPALPPSAPQHGPGCLFNVFTDPTEQHDVAAANPDIVRALRARMASHQTTAYSPHRGGDDGLACTAALGTHGGFWGPFLA